MGDTFTFNAELVFSDPFDAISAAGPGQKLSAEADGIILALQQILAAIREWKERNRPSFEEESPDGFPIDLAANIAQLYTILNNNIWGEFSGGIENYLRRKLGRTPTRAELAKALEDARKAQEKAWRDMLKTLSKIRKPSPEQIALMAYLKSKLGGG